MLPLGIAGFIFGMIAGPVLCFSLAMMIYHLKDFQYSKQIRRMTNQHVQEINKLKRKYRKRVKEYNKTQEKVYKLVDKQP